MSTILDGPALLDRPRLRGVIHAYATAVAAAAGIAVIIGAALLHGPAAALWCSVYALTVCGLFAVSATYHRTAWKSLRAQIRMKRADHSMIFIFIAGSYTPFCVLALPTPMRWWVLGIVWAGALAGVTLKMRWPGSPRWLGVTLYILLGWVIIAVSPTLVAQTGWTVIALLVAGGLLYTVGGIFYALKWPDLWPETFGHHEVFHLCTAIAAALHYIAVWLVLVG